MTKKKRLGRGLEALLSAGNSVTSSPEPMVSIHTEMVSESASKSTETSETSDIVHLGVYEIEDNPFQPRREFSEAEIASLSESLKAHDILQPILVRVVNNRYQLISGERRLRAAIQANWKTIPARIRVANDRLVSELAIVENLQRKDLNPIEKALSFRRYIDEHACTQEDLAGRLKIDRSTLANLIRLLELPRQVQQALSESKLSAGHARALLPLGDENQQTAFSERIQLERLSVRETERIVSERIEEEDSAGVVAGRIQRPRSNQMDAMEQALKLALGTKVKIKAGKRGKGTIAIEFANGQEFERLNELLCGRQVPHQRAA
ncbi:MAG: ParB/RepB/Spo0J family partition protein [Mariniblastus sp.]|nr:ParB/RepB/Spo0J family partition protein [Mariniblastus sp.]